MKKEKGDREEIRDLARMIEVHQSNKETHNSNILFES